MKIAIMSRWNATCGVSLHAELLARSLIKLGYKVAVFAPVLESANTDWHHLPINGEDEEWVYRVYEETDDYLFPSGGRIDKAFIQSTDYDILVVEGYQRFPVREFSKVARRIKERAKLVLVVHTGYVRDLEPFMRINWDSIVVFDERYLNEIVKHFGEVVVRKTSIIPYPHAVLDDIRAYRPEFTDDKILFISYGRQPVQEYLDYVRVLRKLAREYSLVYWVIRGSSKLPVSDPWIVQKVKRPTMRVILSYVMGADIHLLPKSETKAVVVSSTVAQSLYTGTPIVAPNTRYFENIPVDSNGIGPILKYELGNTIDLYLKLKKIIEEESLREEIKRRAREYALMHSSEKVALMFIELFREILREEPVVAKHTNTYIETN